MKSTADAPHYYPLFLNIHKGKCPVVGGGEVALRKVKTLLECGATVAVVSPSICTELDSLSQQGTIHLSKRDYRQGDLSDAIIAIAATDEPAINKRVADDARQQKVLVNVVDEPEQSDFIVPSHFKRGDLIIAVSTSGKSPALARKIRGKIEDEFGSEYADLASLIGEVRTELKRQKLVASAEAWQKAIDLDSLIQLLKDNKRQEAKDLLRTKLKACGSEGAIE